MRWKYERSPKLVTSMDQSLQLVWTIHLDSKSCKTDPSGTWQSQPDSQPGSDDSMWDITPLRGENQLNLAVPLGPVAPTLGTRLGTTLGTVVPKVGMVVATLGMVVPTGMIRTGMWICWWLRAWLWRLCHEWLLHDQELLEPMPLNDVPVGVGEREGDMFATPPEEKQDGKLWGTDRKPKETSVAIQVIKNALRLRQVAKLWWVNDSVEIRMRRNLGWWRCQVVALVQNMPNQSRGVLFPKLTVHFRCRPLSSTPLAWKDLIASTKTLDGFGRNGMLMMWPTGWWKNHILSFFSWYCDQYPIWFWRIIKIQLHTVLNYCHRKMWNPDFDLKDQTWLGLTDEEASSNHTVHWCSITSHESAKQPNGSVEHPSSYLQVLHQGRPAEDPDRSGIKLKAVKIWGCSVRRFTSLLTCKNLRLAMI